MHCGKDKGANLIRKGQHLRPLPIPQCIILEISDMVYDTMMIKMLLMIVFKMIYSLSYQILSSGHQCLRLTIIHETMSIVNR